MIVSVNVGFVTNSSSVVYHLPKAVLEHPAVREYMLVFEVMEGFVGKNIWDRATCGTIALTSSQKSKVHQLLHDDGGSFPAPGDDDIVVVYSDEHNELASQLAGIMHRACKELGLTIKAFNFN